MSPSSSSAPAAAPAPHLQPGAPVAPARASAVDRTGALHHLWPLLVATVGVALVAYAGWARGGDAISWPFTVAGVVAYVAFLLLLRRAQTTPAVSSSAPARGPGATRRSA